MANIPHIPHCEGCSRSRDNPDVRYMISLRQGGMPAFICDDCILELADKIRAMRLERGDFLVQIPTFGRPGPKLSTPPTGGF